MYLNNSKLKKGVCFLINNYLLLIAFLSILFGQILRLEIVPNGSGAITSVDIATAIIIFVYIVKIIKNKKYLSTLIKIKPDQSWRYIAIFLIWAFISLLLNFKNYSMREDLSALLYWLRLLLIFSSVYLLFINGVLRDQRKIILFFISTVFLIILLGYIQLLVFPNFTFMAKYGWDPHVGRMLSTLFDPNFLAAFLALALPIIFLSYIKKIKRKMWLLALFVLTWLAIYLTFSRSGWVTAAIALLVGVWPYSRKICVLFLTIFIVVLFIPNRLSSRFQLSDSYLNGNTANVKNNVQDISGSGDLSATARLLSIRKGLELGKRDWLIGIGYNAYGPAMLKSGLSSQQYINSRAGNGSDSSIINIWVTTGSIGLVLFILFLTTTLRRLYLRWKRGDDVLGMSLFGFTLAWIAGSFINNTLLYVFILFPWLILINSGAESQKNDDT